MVNSTAVGFSRQRVAFSLVADALDYGRLRKKLVELKRSVADCQRAGEVFDRLELFQNFRSDQKRTEFLKLLELLRENPPKLLLEIGSRRGGTLFLFARI